MRRLCFAVAAVAAAGFAVHAADVWKTITLRGEAGFTVSIPSAARNEVDGAKPDDLLFVAVEAKLHGAMTCIAQRSDYPKDVTRETFAAALATARREAFCGNDRAAPGTLSIAGSQSFERDGRQGAVCTASYTDAKASADLSGRVESNMVLAAQSGIYSMTCITEDEDQDVAEYEWASFWGEKARHIQDSFRLPPGR
jgi:hypothetical protein